MSRIDNTFEKRKKAHLTLALDPRNEASECNAFDGLQLRHEAIPDGQFKDIDITSTRFGLTGVSPFFVSSMTAGHEDAPRINHRLMEACAAAGWAMGVGSQRRELSDAPEVDQWPVLLRQFPGVSLMSNLGLAQLIHADLSAVKRLIDRLEATAFIIHCNPLQECIQPEGTPHFKGAWKTIAALVKALPVPVVVKETGCGVSRETFLRLNDLGVAAVDVSGLGGTHWGRIESARLEDPLSPAFLTAPLFKNWGITTVMSLKQARSLPLHYEIWGSGGVRHGLDAAKAIALGATSVGFAKTLLKAALESSEKVYQTMLAIEHALRIAMFCTGAFTLDTLRGKDYVE